MGLFFLCGHLFDIAEKQSTIISQQSLHFYSLLIGMIYSTGVDLWSLTLLEAIFDFGMLLSSSAGIALWDFQMC